MHLSNISHHTYLVDPPSSQHTYPSLPCTPSKTPNNMPNPSTQTPPKIQTPPLTHPWNTHPPRFHNPRNQPTSPPSKNVQTTKKPTSPRLQSGPATDRAYRYLTQSAPPFQPTYPPPTLRDKISTHPIPPIHKPYVRKKSFTLGRMTRHGHGHGHGHARSRVGFWLHYLM